MFTLRIVWSKWCRKVSGLSPWTAYSRWQNTNENTFKPKFKLFELQSRPYLEFLSRKLTISKIMSSNIVQDKVKFTQNINWTENIFNQIRYLSNYCSTSYLEYDGAHSPWKASWRKISSRREKIQSDWPELWSYHPAAPLLCSTNISSLVEELFTPPLSLWSLISWYEIDKENWYGHMVWSEMCDVLTFTLN